MTDLGTCFKCGKKIEESQAVVIEWIVFGKELRASHQKGGCK